MYKDADNLQIQALGEALGLRFRIVYLDQNPVLNVHTV